MDATNSQEKVTMKTGCCDISRVDYITLPCKIACFLLNSAYACIEIFRNVFYVTIGLTAEEAGIISGSCSVISAVAGPCWGLLADRTGCRKLIFIILCVGFACSGFSWPWIAREAQSWSLSNADSINNNRTTDNSTNDQPRCSVMNHTLSNTTVPCFFESSSFSSPLFRVMFSISALTYIFIIPAISFLNSIISNIVENNPTSQGYGEQRMYGSIGVGSANLFAGFAADSFEHATLSKYTAVYIYFLPFILLTIPVSILLFRKTKWNSDETAQESQIMMVETQGSVENGEDSSAQQTLPPKTNRVRILLTTFKNPDNLVITLTVLVVGMTMSATLSFLYLIIKDDMNGSRTLMGLSMMVNSFSSAVMFFFTKRLMKILGGPVPCVEFSLLAWIIRLLLISFIKNPWLMCLPQALQSFTFALYWAAMIQYIQDISTKEVYITLFTLLTSVHFGVGGFLGNVIGGTIYKNHGGSLLFQGIAFLVAIWLLFLVFYFHGIRLIRTKLMQRENQAELLT